MRGKKLKAFSFTIQAENLCILHYFFSKGILLRDLTVPGSNLNTKTSANKTIPK
jgi:hypothetical protein